MIREPGIYRPRSPQKTPFYQCIADHFEEFERVYDERYEREYGFWRPVLAEVIQKYLACGDLTHGFVRIRSLLGKLCLCAWETIKEFFAACLPEGTVPGAAISIQTWGNRGANFHPHLHGLVSKGAFDAHGVFYPLPWIDTQKMTLLLETSCFPC